MISIWEKETFFAQQDIIIIGSGLVGLWSAYHLKRKHPQLKLTILERGYIPTGASTRNAGFACFGSLSEVAADGRALGMDKTLELVELRYRGLEKIRKLFRKEIDFEMCGGYELYESGKVTTEMLEDNIAYINSRMKDITGERKTYRLADEQIAPFGFAGTRHLVKNKLEGYLHSGKLLRLLLQIVQGLGVQVFNNTEVKGVVKNGGGFLIETAQGVPFRSEQVLVCTNAFASALLPHADVVPARGQVLVTTPIPGLPWKGTFHADEGFYYFRNLGKRVLLGGARNAAFDEERTTEMVTSERIQGELTRYLDEIILPKFRGQYTIEMSWAGIMGMGSEKMPILKEVADGLFCAVRMSGMGVALAPVVGQRIAAMMRPSKLREL